jgi:hypothetical protein
MLFAVEGGGFFSASASGYSKGLTLLLLGQKNVVDQKPMRVLPWNQNYQLVETTKSADSLCQLAPGKKRIVRGCTSFFCLGRTAAGPKKNQSPLKVGPTQPPDVVTTDHLPVLDSEVSDIVDILQEDNSCSKELVLKSILKKKESKIQIPDPVVDQGELVDETEGCVSNLTERRKIQWQDLSGGELVDIREFEPSEDSSDDEFINRNERQCSCKIM